MIYAVQSRLHSIGMLALLIQRNMFQCFPTKCIDLYADEILAQIRSLNRILPSDEFHASVVLLHAYLSSRFPVPKGPCKFIIVFNNIRLDARFRSIIRHVPKMQRIPCLVLDQVRSYLLLSSFQSLRAYSNKQLTVLTFSIASELSSTFTWAWSIVSDTESNVSRNVCVKFTLRSSVDLTWKASAFVAVSCEILISNFHGSMMGSQCEFRRLKLLACKLKPISTESARDQSLTWTTNGSRLASIKGRSCRSSIMTNWMPWNLALSWVYDISLLEDTANKIPEVLADSLDMTMYGSTYSCDLGSIAGTPSSSPCPG